MSKHVISILLLAIANVSFASSDVVVQKTKVDYSNPNGCRVFAVSVDPDCSYDLAMQKCEISLQLLKNLDVQMQTESLNASCRRIHTGDIALRFLEEALMNSDSWDGYSLHASVNPAETKLVEGATLKAADEQSCQDVTRVLTTLGFTAACDQLTVTVSR
jgi:hypothetical protein